MAHLEQLQSFSLVGVQMTLARATGAEGQALAFTQIRIVDANNVPTGEVYDSGPAGTVPVATGGSAGAAVAAGQVTQVSASNARVQFTQAALDAGGPMVHLNDGVTGLDLVSADWSDDRFFHLVNVSSATSIPLTAGAGWTRSRSPKLDLAAGAGDLLVLAPGEWARVQMSNGYLNVEAGGGSTVRLAWEANKRYEKGDVVYAVTAQGTIGIGDSIIRNVSGTSAATFSAVEAAKWTEVSEDPDTIAALALKQATSEKNVANGYAGLDSNSKILASQLPSLATTTTTSLAPILGAKIGLPGYRRAKLIPINSISAGSGDYQVYLRVGESAGSAANDSHLGSNSQNFPSAQKLGGELQFVLPDGTDVPFFVVDVTGTAPNRVAHCYLRLSGLTGGAGVQKLVFMLYDNNVLAVASQMSAITAVFDLLADDFDGASVDTGKWTPVNLGAAPSGSVLTFGGGSVARSLESLASFGDNIEMLSRQRLSDTAASYSLHGWNQAGAAAFLFENGWDSATRINKGGVLTTLANGLNHGPGVRDFVRIGRSGGSGRFISTSPANSNTFTSVPAVSGPLRVYNTYDNTAEIDWVAARQYFATEPAFGTVQDV